MDPANDFKEFQGLLDELAAALDKPRPRDEMVRVYWQALLDVPMEEIRGNIKRVARHATRQTPMPRPAELRNTPPPGGATPQQDATCAAAERLNRATWAALKATDPVRFTIEWRIARAARELAIREPSAPDYPEWQRISRKWNDLRYLTHEQQEEALKRLRLQ